MEFPYTRIANKPHIEPLVRVYLFHGKEDTHKQEALDKLVAQVVDEQSKMFDMEICEGKGLTSSRFFAAVSVPPFTSAKRLLVIRRANTIPAAEQEAIAEKLDRVPESSVAVFLVPSPELKDGRPKGGSMVSAKLSKAVANVGVVITFAAIGANDATREIGRRISEAGKSIDGPALTLLGARVAGSLSILDGEVQKVIDYTADRSVVTLRDVELVTTRPPEEQIWKLLDAIGSRDTATALRLLRETLDSGLRVENEAPRVLGMILRQLRFIWQMKALAERGKRLGQMDDEPMDFLPADNNVVAFCKRSQYQGPRLQRQARNFTVADMEEAFERTAAADLAMKGIQGEVQDAWTIMELLVINLCLRRGAPQTKSNR